MSDANVYLACNLKEDTHVVLKADYDKTQSELAELQATIAQQAAEIERLKGGQFDMAVSALNDIIKVSRMGEKPFEIATLAIGEML